MRKLEDKNMGKWEDGEKKEDGKFGRWEDGKVGRSEDRELEEWKGRRI